MKHLLLALALAASVVNAKTVDLSGKKVNWTGSKVIGDSHKGEITITKGSLELDKKKILKGGTFVINMKSINNTDQKGKYKTKLEGHLQSPDFFNVKKFNTATLVIKKVEKTSQYHQVKVTADLTIKSVTKPVVFFAVQTPSSFRGDITFDRTKYDVKYGSSNFFKLAKDKVIKNDVKIDFNFKL